MFVVGIRIIWHHFQCYDCFIPKLFNGTVLSAAVLFVLFWYSSGVTEENHFKPSQIYVGPSKFLYLVHSPVLTNKKLSKKLNGIKCDITLILHHLQVPTELYCSGQLATLVKCKFGISQITSATGLYTVMFGTMMCTYYIEGIHMHTYWRL